MNLAEGKRVTAPEAAENWLMRFAEALQAQDAHAAADMFLADGLWRDVLAFTWTIETMAGRSAIEAALNQTLARTKPCLLYTSDAADDLLCVDLGGRRIIK